MLRFLFSLSAGLILTSFVSASDDPTLEQRLAKLEESLESARVEAHIPGMSIAIVKDDEILWTHGFGLADVAAERAADQDTIYAVGSTTKAFTATLLGMLVDEGMADWDDPVTDHLPYFDLAVRSNDESAQCLLRDLLSHRHGFARMGILMLSGKASREEILRTAAGAEPWDDFRAGFHYCNVTYLAAGQAAGVAAQSTWDEMIVERIFEPLKMSSSTVSLTKAQEDARLARGYTWHEDLGELEQDEMLDLHTIGPAGAINSNVVDMAQWLRLQLGQGKVDELRLISTESILDTWTPQIEIGPGVSYGLGWMLREHDGRKVVEHGGNIDGFSAQIGLIPEENLGYVLLMNLSAAPLQQASLPMVFDALLDEWPDEIALADAEEIDLEEYVGLFVANFGSFRDAEFEILVDRDKLAIDIPGQQILQLKTPDRSGRWYAVLTDQVAVSFDRDGQGAIVGLRIHSDGYKFEVPRKGVELQPDVPVKELEAYVGTYVRVEGGKQIKIFIQQGHLTIEDKGQHLAFHTPDADGHAPLRARADQGATFRTDAEGKVEALIFHGSSGDKLFTRLAESPVAQILSLEEILSLRKTDARIAAGKAAGDTKVSGRVWVAQAGVRGSLTIYTQGQDRYASHMDFGIYGRVDSVAKGEQAWSYNSLRGLEVLKGNMLTQAILAHPRAVAGDWDHYFDSIEVLRQDTLNDRSVYVVRLQRGGFPSHTYMLDAEFGDVLRVKQIALEGPIRIPVTTTFSDFKEVNGIRTAMRIEVENPASGRMVLTIDEIESGLALEESLFTIEALPQEG